MSYQYEIKVDDAKQENKLGFKKDTYIRGSYRLLNGCDKIVYFVDGINKDRRININQLDSYKTSDIEYIPPVVIPEEIIPEIPIIVVDTIKLVDASITGYSNIFANLMRTANMILSVEATGNVNAILDVTTQGIVSVDASLTATANVSADIKRTATLVSSSTTSATTILDATVTKVVDASMTATATTESAAQIVIVVNASADATANISGDASLSYSVNAALEASAQAIVDAQISRILFAEMTATAQTTLEAAVGVTFVSSSVGTATLVNADLLRIATMVSNLTATANLTAATLTTADNVAASVSGAATVSASLTSGDPDSIAFFARVTTAGGSLTATEQTAINTLVLQLKADGIWTKMKAIYPMVGGGQANPAAACAQNLKSASFTGTFTAGWTFASSGATGNGTSSYFDTTFNPNTSISDINSCHLSIYSRTITGNNSVDIGVAIPAWDIEIIYSSFFAGEMNGNYLNIANSDAKGLWTNSRISSSNIVAYRNESSFVSGTSAPTTKPPYNVYIGARNDLNIAKFFSNRQYAFASIGDGLTSGDVSNFYTAVQAFQTTLNRNV